MSAFINRYVYGIPYAPDLSVEQQLKLNKFATPALKMVSSEEDIQKAKTNLRPINPHIYVEIVAEFIAPILPGISEEQRKHHRAMMANKRMGISVSVDQIHKTSSSLRKVTIVKRSPELSIYERSIFNFRDTLREKRERRGKIRHLAVPVESKEIVEESNIDKFITSSRKPYESDEEESEF
jgi:hypothetical protein